LTSVIDFPTAYDVFKELCSQFERNGRGARVRAWQAFWLIVKGTDPVKTYISKIQLAAKAVRSSGGMMDEQLLLTILAGLDDDYNTILMTRNIDRVDRKAILAFPRQANRFASK
jgi:hypothetical protein